MELISSGIARKSYNFIRIMYKINQNDWPKWSKYTDIPNHYSKIPKESGVVFAICFKGYCTVPPKPSFKESKMTWSLATCHAWYSSMEPGRSNLGSTCRNWPQHAQLAVAYWKKVRKHQLWRFFLGNSMANFNAQPGTKLTKSDPKIPPPVGVPVLELRR